MKGNILELKLLKSAVQDDDRVFHEVAIAQSIEVSRIQSGPDGLRQKERSTSCNCQGFRREEGIICLLCCCVRHSPELPKREEMCPDPKSPNAVSKLAGEHHCKVFQELYSLETVVLRYFNVFGPRQDPSSEYSGVISRFISALTKGEQPVIFGDGKQTRDFVYVKDMVRANILASSSGSGVFNIAGGRSTSLNDLAFLIGKIFERNIQPEHRDPRRNKHREAHKERAKGFFFR